MNKIEFLKDRVYLINESLKGAYVNKIIEVTSSDFEFIFSRSQSPSLIISLNSSSPFIKLTKEKYKSTLSSLFFTQLKNKLINSCFIEASLYNEDSIIDLKFIRTTDTYDKIEYHLLFEVFKGNTNLILLKEDKIDLAFRYHSLETSHPLILNTIYLPPKKIEIYKEIDKEKEESKENTYLDNLKTKYLTEKYNSLIHQLKRKRKSLENKKEILENEIKKAEENLKYKEYGDYYLTIMDEIKKGDTSFTYEGVTIPLKANYSVTDNLTYLYKIYKKAKNTISLTSNFLNETINDLSYIDSILALKEIYTEEDYEILISELKKKNIIKIKMKSKEKEIKASLPYYFEYKNVKIGYGKNSLQNNELTFKIARKTDTYLHIASTHGSHVVVFDELEKMDDEVLEVALELVLYLSKKDDGEVFVSPIKNVKKGSFLGETNLLKYETYYYKDKKYNISQLIKNSKRFQ